MKGDLAQRFIATERISLHKYVPNDISGDSIAGVAVLHQRRQHYFELYWADRELNREAVSNHAFTMGVHITFPIGLPGQTRHFLPAHT